MTVKVTDKAKTVWESTATIEQDFKIKLIKEQNSTSSKIIVSADDKVIVEFEDRSFLGDFKTINLGFKDMLLKPMEEKAEEVLAHSADEKII